MIQRPRFAPGWRRLAGAAAVGVLAGHLIGYRLVFPGPQRHGVLAETGHGYLSIAIQIAVALAVIAGTAMLAAGYSRAKAGGFDAPDPRITTARLALLQVAAFVGLEFVERLFSGVPLHHLLLPVLVIGALAQVAIAAIGAALIAMLYRAGAVVARGSVPSRAAAAPRIWIPNLRVASSRLLETPSPIRGPPRLLRTAY